MRGAAGILSVLLLAALPAAAADAPEAAPAANEPAPAVEAPPASAPAASTEQEPPFGLKWGMKLADVTAMGVKVNSSSQSGNLTVVNIKEMPGAFPDTGVVNMLFDRQRGLVKVRWISATIADDPIGTHGRAKYVEMKKAVAEKRGNPTDETNVVGARLFDQEDEFYQCLAYDGCGVWSSLWEQKPSGGVLLSIEGTGPGKGYVQVDYESADWQQVAGTK
jgi:hypothetical protein